MSDDVSSRLRCVTPPASEPVTLSEAKLFLRIEHEADDDAITRTISAARAACEQYLGAALLPQDWEYSANIRGSKVQLPFGPATAIETITLTDSASVETELAETDYRLSIDGFAVYLDTPTEKTVTVRYAASLGDNAASLPALLLQGILHHVAAMMASREGSAPMPIATLQCYQPFRRVRL